MFQTWTSTGSEYTLLQLYLGSNPNSKLEVVSMLNIPSQAYNMYYHNLGDRIDKLNPKIYMGTLQTLSPRWIWYSPNGGSNPTQISGWPQSYQQTLQKGEAKIVYKDLSSITNYYYDQKTYQSRNYNMPFNHITFPYI